METPYSKKLKLSKLESRDFYSHVNDMQDFPYLINLNED